MLTTHSRGLLAAALTLLVACGGKQTKGAEGPALENKAEPSEAAEQEQAAQPSLPAIPDAPQPAPASLLATMVMSNPAQQLAALGQYADAVQPGVGAVMGPEILDQVLGNMVELAGLAGIDYQQTLQVLILNPTEFSSPAVIVAAVADEKALAGALAGNAEVLVQKHKGRVAIGTRTTLIAAAPYALTTLASQAAPAQPTMTVHVPAVLTTFQDQIAGAMSMIESQAASSPDMANANLVAQKLLSFMNQSERVDISLETAGIALTGKMVVVPRPDTALAKLMSEQTPAEFSLLSQVAPGSILAAGRMSASLAEAMEPLSNLSAQQAYGGAAAAKLIEISRSMYKLMEGEGIFSGDISAQTGMWMEGVWQVSDVAKANAAFKAIAAALPKGKMPDAQFTVTPKPKAVRHRGITADGFIIAPTSEMPQAEREQIEKLFGKNGMTATMAAFDGYMAMAMGNDAFKRMPSVIDVIKGKKKNTASPAAAGVLTDAKARRESFVVAFDLATILNNFGVAQAPAGGGDWTTLGLGFDGGTLGVRMTLPASTVRQIAFGVSGGMP